MELTTQERRIKAVQEANALYSYSEETGIFTNRKGTDMLVVADCGAIILNPPARAISAGQAAWYRATSLDPNENQARIYHRDGDPSNNKYDNLLRLIGPSIGRASWDSNQTSEYAGITLDLSKGKWIAYYQVDKKKRYIGQFATCHEAFLARNEVLMARHREEHGDFPITVSEALK